MGIGPHWDCTKNTTLAEVLAIYVQRLKCDAASPLQFMSCYKMCKKYSNFIMNVSTIIQTKEEMVTKYQTAQQSNMPGF